MTAAYYDITVPAGGAFDVNAVGSFIYYLAGSAGGLSERIIVNHPTSGLSMVLYPGQSFQLPANAKMGSNWKIRNADNQATIKGTVVIGSGAFKDNRIVGSVSVVDGGRERSEAGTAFVSTSGSAGAAATYPMIALINPPASGKNLYLSQLIISTSVAGLVTGAIAAGYGNALANGPAAGRAKRGGAPSGVGVMRYGDSAGTPPSTHLLMRMPAQVPQTYKPTEPYMIEPGYGFLIGLGVMNQTIEAMFDTFEQPV